MSSRWPFKPQNRREVVVLAIGALVLAVAVLVSIIGVIRFTQGLLH